MSTRILLRLLLLAGLAAPWCAFALGVGPLEIRSALNERFEAEIPLISTNPAELIGLTAQIPRQQDFDRFGVERLQFFSRLRFSVETPPGGPNVIKIGSTEPIREPNFNLLVEVTWPQGRLFREFPVHLDPELYADRRQPPPPPQLLVIPPPADPSPVAAAPPDPVLPPAPPVSFEGASFYGPVRAGETLTGIANQVRPTTAISLPEMQAILVAGNPEAFIDGNPNRLRAGSVLRVPSSQVLGAPDWPAPAPIPDLATLPTSELPPESPAFPLEPIAPPAPLESLELLAPIPDPPALFAGPEPIFPTPLPTEPLPEIVPEASLPFIEEAPPADELAITPELPAVAAEPSPTVAPVPATPLPPPALPEDIDSGWWKNPVVWLAILLILLAVGAILLLPLLRRPARPTKPAEKTPKPAEKTPEPAEKTSEPAAEPATRRTQMHEPRSVRPRPVPSPAVAPKPKPISELLQEIDRGPSKDRPSPEVGGQPPPPARKPETPRLLDAEPPTASVTRGPMPVAPAPAPKLSQPQTPPEEPSSELRLSDLDFDFDALGLEKTARPATELPPLEMQPTTPGPRTDLPALDFGLPEPVTEPPQVKPDSALPTASVPDKQPVPPVTDQKFEFTDVTQELKLQGREDLFKLDEDLRIFGADSFDLGQMEAASSDGDNAADYVETKMDLATAYLDMGDQVGARSLLEEIVKEGDASQKQRAEELLKNMS
jgi:pilus assembly protein FimV